MPNLQGYIAYSLYFFQASLTIMAVYNKRTIIRGKDRRYSKDYYISSEFAVSDANGNVYVYPHFDHSKAYKVKAFVESISGFIMHNETEVLCVEIVDKQNFIVRHNVVEKCNVEIIPVGPIQKILWYEDLALLRNKGTDLVAESASMQNFRTGQIYWEKPLINADAIHMPQICLDYVVARTYGDEQLFALDTLTGRELWRHDYTEFGRYTDVLQRTLTGCIFDFKF